MACEPPRDSETLTPCLQDRCSAAELWRHVYYWCYLLRQENPLPKRMLTRPRLFTVTGPIFFDAEKPDFETLMRPVLPTLMVFLKENPMTINYLSIKMRKQLALLYREPVRGFEPLFRLQGLAGLQLRVRNEGPTGYDTLGG